MASLKQGDIVLMTKLDRLGRSIRELLELIERIGQGGRRFPIAQFERSLIAECTGDGRKRSIANRVKFGRKPELSGRKL